MEGNKQKKPQMEESNPMKEKVEVEDQNREYNNKVEEAHPKHLEVVDGNPNHQMEQGKLVVQD